MQLNSDSEDSPLANWLQATDQRRFSNSTIQQKPNNPLSNERAAHRLEFGWSLLNWPNFDPCVPSLSLAVSVNFLTCPINRISISVLPASYLPYYVVIPGSCPLHVPSAGMWESSLTSSCINAGTR